MRKFKIAARVQRANYAIRDPEVAGLVRDLKRDGRRILELNIGDPGARAGEYGFAMPGFMKEALVSVVRDGGKRDGYANEQGELELREVIAKDSVRRGIPGADPEKVVVGNGLSEIIDYLLGVLVEEGTNVLVPQPDYPLYSTRVAWYGGQVKTYRLDPDRRWQPDPQDIARKLDANTVALVLINPNNPTGGTVEPETLAAIVKMMETRPQPADDKPAYETILISDEIYHRLRFDGSEHTPTAKLTSKVPIVTLDGISKGFYSPGWRIGHALFSNFADDTVLKALTKVCAFRLSANNAVQHAYAEGLRHLDENRAELDRYLAMMRERGAHAAERLNAIPGIRCEPPRGAFYAFPQVTGKLPEFATDKEFILALLKEKGVRVVHGSGFGMDARDMFFRVVTCPSIPAQDEAYDLLRDFMAKHLA